MPKTPDLATTLQARLGSEPAALDPAVAFARLIDFFEAERVEGAAPPKDDGDMLLFQYGLYKWSGQPRFELDLTRQLVFTPDDPDEPEIWQLHLVYRFDPAPALAELGKHHQWFYAPAEAAAARDHIATSPALRACRGLKPVEAAIEWEQT